MLEDSVKKSVPNSNGFGKPTNKMLAYVKKLAEQVGVELNEDDLSTFHKVSVLIDELQKRSSRRTNRYPSQKSSRKR